MGGDKRCSNVGAAENHTMKPGNEELVDTAGRTVWHVRIHGMRNIACSTELLVDKGGRVLNLDILADTDPWVSNIRYFDDALWLDGISEDPKLRIPLQDRTVIQIRPEVSSTHHQTYLLTVTVTSSKLIECKRC